MWQGQSRQARYKKATSPRYIVYGFAYRIFSILKSLVGEQSRWSVSRRGHSRRNEDTPAGRLTGFPRGDGISL